MGRPVIGIAAQTLPAVPGERPHCWIVGHLYSETLRLAGGLPWIVPLLPHDPEAMADLFDRLDGVLLTGGVDVDPARYGKPRQPYCNPADPDRDATELMLIRHAIDTRKPIFAICRGLQIFNVACGGTLFQDIAAERPGSLKHDYFPTPLSPSRAYLAHLVTVDPASRLGHALGETSVPVNSLHHQGIDTLGDGLVVTATAPDGVIEAVELPGVAFAVAVQWHPEELAASMAGMRRLFAEFIGAAK